LSELKMKKQIKRKEADINDASHPARRAAIHIIEEVVENHAGRGFNGEEYYNLEDQITNIIHKEYARRR
jgi:hypothetical protein